MPFITEELWHELKNRTDGEDIIIAPWPNSEQYDAIIISEVEKVLEVVTQIRNIKAAHKLAKHVPTKLLVKSNEPNKYLVYHQIIERLTATEQIELTYTQIPNVPSFVLGADEFFIPIEIKVDIEKETQALKAEIEYTQGFLKSVESKLNNEKFMGSAPEKVVAMERKKQADAIAKLNTLNQSLDKLLNSK
jgi:valyl-tRNA synthetase